MTRKMRVSAPRPDQVGAIGIFLGLIFELRSFRIGCPSQHPIPLHFDILAVLSRTGYRSYLIVLRIPGTQWRNMNIRLCH